MRPRSYLLVSAVLAILLTACHTQPSIDAAVDWESFLGRHDLLWDSMATKWEEAPFLGNGMMGTMIWQTGDHMLRWDIGRGDVQDHRPGGGMYNRCRLPVGYFMLRTVGKITGGTMKLDLWNAEAIGMVETDSGMIHWRSIVHAEEDILVTILEPSEGERDFHWEWKSQEAKFRSLSFTKRETRKFNRLFFSGAVEIIPDKQGRILIPTYLKQYAGIKRDIMIIGVSSRLEIWSREKWLEFYSSSKESFEDIAEKLIDLE